MPACTHARVYAGLHACIYAGLHACTDCLHVHALQWRASSASSSWGSVSQVESVASDSSEVFNLRCIRSAPLTAGCPELVGGEFNICFNVVSGIMTVIIIPSFCPSLSLAPHLPPSLPLYPSLSFIGRRHLFSRRRSFDSATAVEVVGGEAGSCCW
eukprot:GHVU01013426.1.p1 GENE.GHVU01013426.1~~GHVU01013426.1.p1  ORF type:complete len:156 (-),score=5.42 GHVU01013426.1:300-767(-)